MKAAFCLEVYRSKNGTNIKDRCKWDAQREILPEEVVLVLILRPGPTPEPPGGASVSDAAASPLRRLIRAALCTLMHRLPPRAALS